MGDGMTKKHHLLLYSLLGVCLVIAVGYPAEDAPRPKQRKAMESVARFIR